MGKIYLTGDGYLATFFVPPGTYDFSKNGRPQAYASVLPVGIDYIEKCIEFVGQQPSDLLMGRGGFKDEIRVLYRLTLQGDKKAERPVLGLEGEILQGAEMSVQQQSSGSNKFSAAGPTAEGAQVPIQPKKTATPCPDAKEEGIPKESCVVCLDWVGEHAIRENGSIPPTEFLRDPKWAFVQVGLPGKVGPAGGVGRRLDDDLWKEASVRMLVVNLGEIRDECRVRHSISYEAIAVDLLRGIRGSRHEPDFSMGFLKKLGWNPPEKGSRMPKKYLAGSTGLVVRINSGAAFVYLLKAGAEGDLQEKAYIVCRSDQPAPLNTPELGRMIGHTGFVSAHLANFFSNAKLTDDKIGEGIVEQVKSSLVWQEYARQRGYLDLMFDDVNEDGKAKYIHRGNVGKFAYKHMLDALREFKKDEEEKNKPRDLVPVSSFQVDIKRAIAHRTEWYLARGVQKEDGLEKEFLTAVKDWLCGSKMPGESGAIPVLRLGGAELTDRREIEDYLALNQAMRVYGSSRSLTNPLSVAVFGAPGTGKSFAVKQIVQHIGAERSGMFAKDYLEFNLGQFRDYKDLVSALHLVRNECLRGEIPVVFFDEFDSDLNGRAFGWLKYFLAPMQDANFFHDGSTYRLGRSVFVFAGGVNRSFEEMNGRLRNPGFCEGKGPDFISRLKAHLDLQGINKPEDPDDQFRYILRRGILLRSIVRRHWGMRDGDKDLPYFQEDLAAGLLGVERFRHGVRSLEAIVRMCSGLPRRPISASDLPAVGQLDMHVDAAQLVGSLEKGKENGGQAAGSGSTSA